MFKEYLGDGVYIQFDGYRIVVTTSDGISDTNTIVFEPEVLNSFINFIERLKANLLNRIR